MHVKTVQRKEFNIVRTILEASETVFMRSVHRGVGW